MSSFCLIVSFPMKFVIEQEPSFFAGTHRDYHGWSLTEFDPFSGRTYHTHQIVFNSQKTPFCLKNLSSQVKVQSGPHWNYASADTAAGKIQLTSISYHIDLADLIFYHLVQPYFRKQRLTLCDPALRTNQASEFQFTALEFVPYCVRDLYF